MEKTPLIKLSQVSKYYKTKTGVSEGMRNVNLEFYNNEFVAITGESGSGKTTLLNVISGLDSYEDGELYYNDKETSHFSVKDFEKFRAKNIGFVFQNYNVIDSYSVYDNVAIALLAQNYPKKEIKSRALEIIEKVGLLSHKNQKTSKLSGGQKQRVVIARALAKDAPIILADEPTGNLDETSSDEILTLLKDVSEDRLVILVSHNIDEVNKFATRKVVMEDGNIKNDILMKKTEITPANIIEDFKVENSVDKGFRIAVKNLISTPRRTIFSLLLSMIIMFSFIYFYSSLVVNTVESLLGISGDEGNLIAIIKRDETPFSKADFNSFDETKYVSVYFDMEFESIDLYETIEDMEANYVNTIRPNLAASVFEDKLKEGNYPKNKHEILIKMNEDAELYDFVIGEKITLNNIEFTVSGIIEEDNRFWSNNYISIYFSNDFIYNDSFEVNEEAKSFLREIPTFEILIASAQDRREVKLYKKQIGDQYQIIDQALAVEKQMEFIIGTIKLLLWIVLIAILQIIFLVVYQVQKNIMEARKKDFSVYRSVGVSEQEVSFMILFEQLIIAAIASIFIVIILNILRFRVTFVYNIVRNITFFNYIIIVVLFALFSLRLGQRFNKKIYGLTVIEALKEDY